MVIACNHHLDAPAWRVRRWAPAIKAAMPHFSRRPLTLTLMPRATGAVCPASTFQARAGRAGRQAASPAPPGPVTGRHPHSFKTSGQAVLTANLVLRISLLTFAILKSALLLFVLPTKVA